MTKHLFFLAAGALAFTACTSEDVIDDVATSRNVIKFENVVNKPSRAVTDLITNELTHFKVYGFYMKPGSSDVHPVFENVSVDKDDNNIWKYTDRQRFWTPGATYYFYAYSCGNSSELDPDCGTISLDMNDGADAPSRTLQITDFVCDNTHQHDMIYAQSIDEAPASGLDYTVSLPFTHILSKIKATFTSKFGSEYDVVIKNVYVNNIYNKANYSLTDGWTGFSRPDGVKPVVYLQNTNGEGGVTAEHELVSNSEGKDGKAQTISTEYAYVIPTTYAEKEVNLTFTVDVMYDGDCVVNGATLTAQFKPEWESGHTYSYNVEIGPETFNMKEIKFNVTVSGWNDGEDVDLEINAN